MMLTAGTVATAAAQPQQADADLRRFVVGGDAVLLMVPERGPLALPGAIARVNLKRGLSVELTTDFELGRASGFNALYRIQVQFSFPESNGSPRRIVPFLTAGAGGFFESFSVQASHYTLPTGDVVDRPVYRRTRLSAPLIAVLGIGARIPIPGRAWIEAGGHFWYGDEAAALSLSASVLLPFGGVMGKTR
jgi:hypothetical protein